MGELVGDFNEFFAPVATDMISTLVAQYDGQLSKIKEFHKDFKEKSLCGVLSHFCNRKDDRMPNFSLDDAVCSLNAEFWAKAFALTDVYEAMPQKRRDAWYKQLNEWREPRYRKGENLENDLPDFTEDVVRATLMDLLDARGRFFAERVDGIFRSLSKEHVTNCPQAFGKRFIIGGVLSYGSPCWTKSGYISDLRCVIAKFMGRDNPEHRGNTDAVIKAAMRHTGEWITVDGGAFRIRVYNGVGTAHLEVHPDMAWRLNAVLASIYPAAIPESLRRKPVKAKKVKDFVLFERPLPFAVVSALASLEEARELINDNGWCDGKWRRLPNTLSFIRISELDKHVIAETDKVLRAIGGVRMTHAKGWTYYQFDFDPASVIEEIVCSGCIPDQKSHQYYETPPKIAEAVVALADIGDLDTCLEPSAGQGGLASYLPLERTTCVEISKLHCDILKAKGIAVQQADFMAISKSLGKFSRIVMNPPFSEGRAKSHVEAAVNCLSDGGKIVAVVPMSLRNTLSIDGCLIEWPAVFHNEFAGTGISVAVMVGVKK